VYTTLQSYHGTMLEKEWTYLSPFWYSKNKKPHLFSRTSTVTPYKPLIQKASSPIHIAHSLKKPNIHYETRQITESVSLSFRQTTAQPYPF